MSVKNNPQALPDDQQWRPVQFHRAVPNGEPVLQWGYGCHGLALQHSGWAVPRSKTRWTLVHIGSGSPIMRFTGTVATVMPVAGKIAGCSDWSLFDLPQGWRQADPDLPAKVASICRANPQARPDTDLGEPPISDADARAVVEARERAEE